MGNGLPRIRALRGGTRVEACSAACCSASYDHSAKTSESIAKQIALLKVLGTSGKCRGCHADIWWLRTKTGQLAPFNTEGVSHFSDCPKADVFRRKSSAANGDKT